MPDEYTGGVGKEGVENLKKFVEAGGTLVFLNRASDFAIEQFDLPIRDVTKGLARKDFYIPGSILRTELDTTNPIAKGMPAQSIAWFENGPAFDVSEPPAVAGGLTQLGKQHGVKRSTSTTRYRRWFRRDPRHRPVPFRPKEDPAFRLGPWCGKDRRQSGARRGQVGQRQNYPLRLPPAIPRPIACDLSVVFQCNIELGRSYGALSSRYNYYRQVTPTALKTSDFGFDQPARGNLFVAKSRNPSPELRRSGPFAGTNKNRPTAP